MERFSSGIADLDTLLDGLISGDNMVWVAPRRQIHEAIERPFIEQCARDSVKCTHVTTSEPPAKIATRLGTSVEIVDARAGRRLSDPTSLERAILERGTPSARLVIDGLDELVGRWGPDRALAMFRRTCPQLFDLGAVAYWRASRAGSGAILEGVRRVTQCVLEVSGGHLRVLKAEGRTGAQGRILKVRFDDGGLRLEHERALGRLSQGLRRIRDERSISQTELARLGGVSPSAISQAEAGLRGLGLDTLLTVSEALAVGLDELLANRQSGDYLLARRDRAQPRHGMTPLLDDPQAGMRAYLVDLGPGERGRPSLQHKGIELVLVAFGLVQIDLGTETPVVRAGDAVLATRVPVQGWHNLLGQPARLFWILRD